jgi:F-type H+-transporting ATPase subunit delta
VARTNVRAARYAKAAFGVAERDNRLDVWAEALGRAVALFDNRAAERFLTSPVVPPPRKEQALRELLPDAPQDVRNFLGILARRGRLELVPEIDRAFRRLLNQHRGVQVAQVTTAIPLDQAQRDLIAARLTARTGKTVTLETHVDPNVLGGVVAQIGDDVIDGSVRGRLDRLRRALAS